MSMQKKRWESGLCLDPIYTTYNGRVDNNPRLCNLTKDREERLFQQSFGHSIDGVVHGTTETQQSNGTHKTMARLVSRREQGQEISAKYRGEEIPGSGSSRSAMVGSRERKLKCRSKGLCRKCLKDIDFLLLCVITLLEMKRD